MLAITAHGDKYYPLTQQQYYECLKLGQQTRLCAYTQSIHNKGSTANSCEVNLFNNETQLSCEVIKVPHSQWTQMTNKNQWLFSLKDPIKMTGVCGSNIQQIMLEGAGILKIGSDCTLKSNLFTLIGHQTLYSSTNISITSQGQWEYLQNPKTTEPVAFENAIQPYNNEINEIIALQKIIREQHIDKLHSHLQSTTHHFLSVGYAALILTIIIGLYLLSRRRNRQNSTLSKPEEAPTQASISPPIPATRLGFSVDV